MSEPLFVGLSGTLKLLTTIMATLASGVYWLNGPLSLLGIYQLPKVSDHLVTFQTFNVCPRMNG